LVTNVRYVLYMTFLPVGYPDSVKPEYLEYQMWDCIQGMSSYLRSVLTTKSVLQGAGVGSAEATPLAAALVWVFRDGIGMIGSLVFAYAYSDCFEMYTKEWRLLADILNNIGLTLDLLTSLVPQYFLYLTSLSTLSKSCCGLLAGATKARISAHFALQGHLADVTAKESTQETAVALSGLLLGMLLARWIGSHDRSTWGVFFLLLLLHQYSNYQLIRVLVFDTLNPQRCFLLALIDTHTPCSPSPSTAVETEIEGAVPGDRPFPRPQEVADRESIFRPLYLSLWGPRIGESLQVLLAPLPLSLPAPSSQVTLQRLLGLWRGRPYLIGLDGSARVVVCLQAGCLEGDTLAAFLVACRIHHSLHSLRQTGSGLGRLQAAYGLLVTSAASEALLWWEEVDRNGRLERGGWSKRDVWANLKPNTWRYDPHGKTKDS